MIYPESFYKIRFGDCDPFRHLNNARYVDYLLNAREDHLMSFYNFDLSSTYKDGRGWVVSQHEIRYLRPAAFNETVCISSCLLDAGPDHLQVEMIMFDEKKTHLKALLHTLFIPVSLHTGKKESHHIDFMDFLQDKLVPGISIETTGIKERIAYWQEQIRLITTPST